MSFASDRPVCVTGANGYVASWVVKKLLTEGVPVHATVRDPTNPEKVQHLKRLADETGTPLRLFAADLVEPESFDEAVRDCQAVLHTASPFFTSTKDPQKDLVDPAVDGTKNVLGSADRAASVERVVLTSSCAAIYGDARDMSDRGLDIFTEEQWNESSTLQRNPYSYSKTVAERTAWDVAMAQDRWKLVVVNPGFVMGPSVDARPDSTSVRLITELADGTSAMGVPDLPLVTVDVREVADAHFEALRRDDAEGRHILAEGTHRFLEMAHALRERYGDRLALPKRTLPKWLVWLVSPARGIERSFIADNVGYVMKFDNTKARTRLGITFRPMAESITEHVQQLIDLGVIKPKN